MNPNVYDNLNEARQRLFDLQISYFGKKIKAELDVVGMALDDCMDELDRLDGEIKRLESGGK